MAQKQRTEREHLEVFRSSDGTTSVTDKQSGIVLTIRQSHPLMNGPRHVLVEAYSMDADSSVYFQANGENGVPPIVGKTVLHLFVRKDRPAIRPAFELSADALDALAPSKAPRGAPGA